MSQGTVLVIGGQKGGTGKTTIAFNLAVMARRTGQRVILIDADPQGTASKICAIRDDLGVAPSLTCVEKLVGDKGKPLAMAATVSQLADEYDLVLVDVGGFDSERRKNPEMRGALIAADLFLVPLHATPIDSWSIDDVVNTLQGAIAAREERADGRGEEPKPLRAITIYSKAPTNPGQRDRMLASSRQYSEEEGQGILEDSGCYVANRQAYAMSILDGLAVIEGRDANARQEMLKLYRAVFGVGYGEVDPSGKMTMEAN